MYQSWMVEDSEKNFRGALLIGCIYLEGPLGFICWSDQSMPGLFYVFLCCSEWSLAGPFHQDFLREFQLVIDGLLYQQNPLQIRTRVLVGGKQMWVSSTLDNIGVYCSRRVEDGEKHFRGDPLLGRSCLRGPLDFLQQIDLSLSGPFHIAFLG